MDDLEQYLIDHQADYPTANSRLLREVAYERLKDAIRHADLNPGEPLSENRISKVLGISRTPVREALQMLSDLLGGASLRPQSSMWKNLPQRMPRS